MTDTSRKRRIRSKVNLAGFFSRSALPFERPEIPALIEARRIAHTLGKTTAVERRCRHLEQLYDEVRGELARLRLELYGFGLEPESTAPGAPYATEQKDVA